MSKYVQLEKWQVPANVRFDVQAHRQGQIVEVAYGGFDRAEHGPGDLYKRVTDRGVGGGTRYYIRAPHINDARGWDDLRTRLGHPGR